METIKQSQISAVAQRLKQYRISRSLSQQQLAEKMGISRGYLAEIERGGKEPSFHFLQRLLDATSLSSEWILRGTDPMFAEESSIRDGDPKNAESLEGAGIQKLPCGLFTLGHMVYVPLSSITACCGKGFNVYDDYSLGTAIAVTKRNIGSLQKGLLPYAVMTEGCSMEGYGIREGSTVIVNPAEKVYSGCVAMVIFDERASIKKVYDTRDGKNLISSSGHKIHVTDEELSEDWGPRICGRVMVVISPPDDGV
jgi:transcriptional regulator with XRE-family HTH domain